jgi:hypothetical protein
MINFFKKKTKVLPATEPITNFDIHRIKRKGSYLVKEPKPMMSFEIFTSTVKGICADCQHSEAFSCESIGCEECTLDCPCKNCLYSRAQGLCFTVDSPEITRQKYLLQTTPVFWISKHGTNSINPSNLEVIADIVKDFTRKSKNPVVLLDGLEYLVIINGFIPVLKFLYDVREWIILHDAFFIFPVSPPAFNEKELALIQRDVGEIIHPE